MAKIVHVQTVMLQDELDELKQKAGTPVTKDALYKAVEHYLKCKCKENTKAGKD